MTLLIGAVTLATSADAQSTPPPAAITRTVIATTKLPTVTEVPLYFRAVSVTLPPSEKSSVSAANGILYQMSGSTEVAINDQATTLKPGDGTFIAAGSKVTLTAGSGVPSTFLHFILAPATDLDRPAETAAAGRELYRTATAIPGLKAGGYDIESDADNVSAADAIQPAAPSIGGSFVFHPLGDWVQHGGRKAGGEGTRFIDL